MRDFRDVLYCPLQNVSISGQSAYGRMRLRHGDRMARRSEDSGEGKEEELRWNKIHPEVSRRPQGRD